MKIKFVIAILVMAAYFIPAIATAEVFDIVATGEYIMGDNDTKIEARRMALEHAKRSAAEKAGSYLESTTVVKNNILSKDEISSFTSAILQTTVVSENVSLLQNKTTLFQINIKASVDTSVLEKKLAELKNDSKRKEQLAKLQEENNNLLIKLDNLSKQLNTQNAAELKQLREQREELFTQIDKNNSAIHITFAKGTLLNLALKSLNNLEESKAKIDKIMQIIGNSVLVSISDPQVRHGDENSDLIVSFSWDTNRENLLNIIPLFNDICSRFNQELSRWVDISEPVTFDCDFKDKINKHELEQYLNGYKIGITINAGVYNEYFSVKNGGYSIVYLKDVKQFKKTVKTSELDGITNIDAKVSIESHVYN